MYKINVLCIKFSDILAYLYALETFIEIRRAVSPFAVVSSAETLLFSGSVAPVGLTLPIRLAKLKVYITLIIHFLICLAVSW